MNIVIVDDSLTIRLTIESFLDDLGVDDDTINSFSSALEALSYIEKSGADLILSDMYMPEMDGFEFAEKVFTLDRKYRTIFFVVSGEEDYNVYKRMKQIGVTKFIKKPLNFQKVAHFLLPIIKKYHSFKSK